MKIIIYGKNDCVYTQSARKALDSFGFSSKYIEIPEYYHGAQIARLTQTTSQTVPVILINDVWIGGYDELKVHMNNVWESTSN